MSPAQAREQAGMTLEQAAKRARLTPAYLRQIERRGAPWHTARRLAALYQCSLDIFLLGCETPENAGRRGGSCRSAKSKQ